MPNIDTGKLLRSVIHTIVPHHDGPVVAADVVDGEEDALVVFVLVGLLEVALDKKTFNCDCKVSLKLLLIGIWI